jgi:hypothetical protein
LRQLLVLAFALPALALTGTAAGAPPDGAGPPQWPADRPHPVFAPTAVVPEAAISWQTGAATRPGHARAAVTTYCQMSLAGVFKSGGNIWGSGQTSCTWNVTHIQMTLCLYRTSWLALVRCGRVLYAAGNSGAGSIVNDCPAGNQRFYMSGQTTSVTPQGTVIGPLGWVGGQIYSCT